MYTLPLEDKQHAEKSNFSRIIFKISPINSIIIRGFRIKRLAKWSAKMRIV